jgi:hypothetical protein
MEEKKLSQGESAEYPEKFSEEFCWCCSGTMVEFLS